MKRVNDISISRNFKLYEFECKDGSHQVVLQPELVNTLQKLRDRIGKPIVINSAYRNVTHNEKVGGVKDSYHVKGMAVDIKLPSGMTLASLYAHAKTVGFKGIGLYDWGLHLDVRPTFKTWDYRKK